MALMMGLISKFLVGALVIAMLFYAGVSYFSDLNEGYDAGISQNLSVTEQADEVEEITEDIAESMNQTSGDYTGLGYALLEGGLASVKLLPVALDIMGSVIGTIFSSISMAVPLGNFYLAMVLAILAVLVVLYVAAIIIGRQGGSL